MASYKTTGAISHGFTSGYVVRLSRQGYHQKAAPVDCHCCFVPPVTLKLLAAAPPTTLKIAAIT